MAIWLVAARRQAVDGLLWQDEQARLRSVVERGICARVNTEELYGLYPVSVTEECTSRQSSMAA